ncbi:peptide deformylase [Wukongibacter baidiensis]|uniref:peptide deformylase n=1 Tax=Wukongibacter baidiensis TaxID=1723361 RepID=UPI003D7FF853
MAIRNIRTDDDPVLRKISRPVGEINDRVIQIIDDMADTMYNTGNGIGLAAPQIGILRRIVIIDIGDGLVELINPEIVEQDGSYIDVEGCLSLPERSGDVERPFYVKVKALNRKGEEFHIEGEELLARVLCHEIDHLNGILFTDKIIEE